MKPRGPVVISPEYSTATRCWAPRGLRFSFRAEPRWIASFRYIIQAGSRQRSSRRGSRKVKASKLAVVSEPIRSRTDGIGSIILYDWRSEATPIAPLTLQSCCASATTTCAPKHANLHRRLPCRLKACLLCAGSPAPLPQL